MPDAFSPVTVYDRPDLGETQQLVVKLTGRDKRVLEMGANTGYMSVALRDNGCHVTATDYDERALPKLSSAADRAMWCDLTRLETLDSIAGEEFDAVVFADVLEHLPDPAPALDWAAAHLAVGGRVVVSLPNIAHWSIRAKLARGNFAMTRDGILDRTHLRFFTLASAEEFFASAGLRVMERHTTVHPVRGYRFNNLVPAAAREAATRVARVGNGRFPGFYGYQAIWALTR